MARCLTEGKKNLRSHPNNYFDRGAGVCQITLMNKPIHPLRRWLFESQQTLATFSESTGISQGHLSEIITGKKRPSLNTIDKITLATNGKVKANDFQKARVSA